MSSIGRLRRLGAHGRQGATVYSACARVSAGITRAIVNRRAGATALVVLVALVALIILAAGGHRTDIPTLSRALCEYGVVGWRDANFQAADNSCSRQQGQEGQ
jgi:hypothetical protein